MEIDPEAQKAVEELDLIPCNAAGRDMITDLLYKLNHEGVFDEKAGNYAAKTFPSILIDVARHLTEQATLAARGASDPATVIKEQLKPYLMFSRLLGKCPQIAGLMYSYFESSSFQPLPKDLFSFEIEERKVVYHYPGFSDEQVKDILFCYFKYLTFNPKWFSAVWNWSELGKFITIHPEHDISYLAFCCLSIITKPSRSQHLTILRESIGQPLIDLQIKYRHIYDNTFKPCIETKPEMAKDFLTHFREQNNSYLFCPESMAKVANILLLKRDTVPSNSLVLCKNVIENFVPVASLNDTISRIAYSISINKPCLLRGSCGSGKTAILDYIAAKTNRSTPPDYVKIQIGDQIDSKLLIGSYICTEIPGQFEWQPGPLTKAMAYGSWIVFEDIDSAPSDMAQVIHSVIENGNLTCVSCCPIKLDNPHPDFRILFTQRSQQSKSTDSFKLGFGFVERQCDIIDIPELSDADLMEVLETKYKFGKLTQIILQLYRKAEEVMKTVKLNRALRVISLRDLFKLCDRLAANNLQQVAEKYSANSLESIYMDTIDCFLSSLPKDELKQPAEELGLVVNIPSNEVQRLVFQREPEIREEDGSIIVGRAEIKKSSDSSSALRSRSTLAYTQQSLKLIESIAICINKREPVLLVGETGVGKTSIIQHLANLTRTELVVINLSQQSDSSDLLGGFKPVEMREVVRPINDQFEELFKSTWDANCNETFMKHVNDLFFKAKTNSLWSSYLKLVVKLCAKALCKKELDASRLDKWKELYNKSRRLAQRVSAETDSPMALSFSEGTLLRAVKEGNWILLDEINLADSDVLQCLLLVLDSIKQSHIFIQNPNERNGPIRIHPNFRLFACMNPSTDIGKRDLTPSTRGRFSEFFVDDVVGKNDLRLIVESYVKTCLNTRHIENIVNFYLEVRVRSSVLSDISGNSPVYSLRTLCRALSICANNVCRNMEKSLLESLKITFLQQLNIISTAQVLKLIEQIIFDRITITSLNETAIPMPIDNHKYLQIQDFWLQTSSEPQVDDKKYVVTLSVKRNLQNLSRIISLSRCRLPILIQGNTSVGKTSLIMHLAKLSGNKCYRINNHEHTDLQEYVGRYVLKETGDLYFQEGLLVRALKKGYWIILDELNLAPCELLEALNRVLDDNRELFIPETRETIKAHAKFMLFATQNPPEEYAGRKLLSRAFRNRFVELHFDDISHVELESILEDRCEMPAQYAKKIVSVMKELQLHRRESVCFNGKNGFMTLRDLFRWGERYAAFKKEIPDDQFYDWDAFVASEGLILLEGRVRTLSEADTVKAIIEKVFRLELNRKEIYGRKFVDITNLPSTFKHIFFSDEFKKLFIQLSSALKYKEPVLLCGQTGCGKTTACQLYAALNKQDLKTYNCHLNSESADFVGGVRPSRDEEHESGTKQTFPWVNGPLVEAMMNGSIFLMDEISLADDAVLERINSVLEPGRSITLTERDGEEIFACDSFRLVATMNPGGDYGKKELSPALRNRFTEIYCHNTTDITQISKMIEASLSPTLLKPKIGPKLLNVMHQFLEVYYKEYDFISIRDILSWVQFINKTVEVAQPRPLSIQEAIINGASLVFFDQIGTCGHKTVAMEDDSKFKRRMKALLVDLVNSKFGSTASYSGEIPKVLELNQDIVKFKKFCLAKGPLPILENVQKEFVLEAPIVSKNLLKIVRAMLLSRPILLEGDPGAGKTSVITALAKLTGHKLVRINLSEQTDISDLFGSDLPDTDNSDQDSPRFCWHDGPLLAAIKNSDWVLLDEMNLASQSVLEGLNACFDHRGEIYIAELNKTFKIDRSSTRIFACQNPYSQGSARKGLPQSFLNRFTSIYIESHTPQDLVFIIHEMYPNLPKGLIESMVEFNSEMSTMFQHSSHEFNLRNILYWCDLLTCYVNGKEFKLYKPDRFVQFVYLDRMRLSLQESSIKLKQEICERFERIFGYPIYEPPYRDIRLGEYSFIIGRAILQRRAKPSPHLSELCILKYQMPFMESIAKAIEHKKMPIIVGEAGVGKRSMVRILAGLTGNDLNIIGANREMDTVELLGSFEQKSLQRELVDLVDQARCCVTAMINSISQKQYASTWRQLFGHIWAVLYSTSLRDLKLSKSKMMDAYRLQLSQMKDLIEKIQPLSQDDTAQKCTSLIAKISYLQRQSLYYSEAMYSSGNFEWIDSVLVKSIREGSWLMIENANLLNPATLDRLNSLVESNGTLCLNEKGSGKHGIEVLTPNPDFRLILTMDPDHGELSRAMRNRGVEIYVQTRFYFEDFLMLLNQNGFEPEMGKACMTYCIMQSSCDFHKKITGEAPEDGGSLLAYFGLNYISLITNQVRRGLNIDNILPDLLIAYYSQRNFAEECSDSEVRDYFKQQFDQYKKQYVVDLSDQRYNWRHLRHDLVSLTGGDAIIGMVERDHVVLYYDDPTIETLLRQVGMIDNPDVVNTCTSVKIFLELSTHGDFEYRKGFIRAAFLNYPELMNTVNKHVDLLHNELLPVINSLLPNSKLIPDGDLQVDSRNAPDIHYNLQSLDFDGTVKRQGLQNRWILSLHRIMLRMIVEIVEERSANESCTNKSLWMLSEKVRLGEMPRENLIRPTAEIAVDLYDLLTGILRVVSNRCFDDQTVSKMIPRFFWINYFILKLRRYYNREQLIAVCNQIPMLWALTYQKVIEPIIKDCGMCDLTYKHRKFSARIEHICDFLDMTIIKPGDTEKSHYKRVLNMYASTKKQCEVVSREVDKLFAKFVGRYTTRSQSLSLGSDNMDTLAAASDVWSNSEYLSELYAVEDHLLTLSSKDEAFEEANNMNEPNHEHLLTVVRMMNEKHMRHEDQLKKEQYRFKCLNTNRRKNALDQFAPIWQFKLVQTQLAKLSATVPDPLSCRQTLRHMLECVNGLMISPRYYATLIKYLQKLHDREESQDSTQIADQSTDLITHISKEDVDMYTAFLAAHFIENAVLDHQVVGWTKLRVTTSDLPALAPLIPEYCPIVSLVGSYCLDISHLKLNSYLCSAVQLDSMLLYLWQNYVPIKFDADRDTQDINLARNLMHLRSKLDKREELIGNYQCGGAETDDCCCVEEYIQRKVPTFEKVIETLELKLPIEDIKIILKSVKLIYFGYLNFVEYAPIFTLDPSLRSREKLEVYTSELAHVKLELHTRNSLFYWKTGENLQLNEIDPEDAIGYPFSTRILIDRRAKLENSINNLRRQHTNRPKSDDGLLYYDLRKDVEVNINRYTSSIHVLINDLLAYAESDLKTRSTRFANLITKCRMLIKNLEKSISRFQNDYLLYTDLITNFQVGMCFVSQGLRCLYSRLEQRMQVIEYGFSNSIQRYYNDISRVFSFVDFSQGIIESVLRKLEFFPRLDKVCPSDRISNMQSLLLHTVLNQLNHHITITPSDIKKCIPIVRRIADLFHAAWLKKKLYLEEQRRLKEEDYHYKTSTTTLGPEMNYDRREFLDLCAKFPTYDHIYRDQSSIPSTERENLDTEEKVLNLNRSVDLSMCIDICKAHYKFFKEASKNLLYQVDPYGVGKPSEINLSQVTAMEAELFYTIIRHCIPTLDRSYDAQAIECHLLQAHQLSKVFHQTTTDEYQLGSLKSSIEILDEDIFDIYHDSRPREALKFQEFITNLNTRLFALEGNDEERKYSGHPMLSDIATLTTRISSFMISDPLMKFITGSHSLLEKITEWNKNSIPKEDKLLSEADSLIELIHSWRKIEVQSWKSSLHRVKKNYIDSTLCDLWFELYDAFNNPIVSTRNRLRKEVGDDFIMDPEHQDFIYFYFAASIRDFFEESTLGDYQIRLDLVFSFVIQMRFTGLYKQAGSSYSENLIGQEKSIKLDFDLLTSYAYNTYRQYQGLFEPVKAYLEEEERASIKELDKEIRIVNWQGTNLWDIKNNFRISHRKLNKVMNKYLAKLRLPARPPYDVKPYTETEIYTISDKESDSERISATLACIRLLVEKVNSPSSKYIGLTSLQKATLIVDKLKQLYRTVCDPMISKYVDNLVSIEQSLEKNTGAIQNFHQHKVDQVKIDSKDSSEVKTSKYKLCRQMYHSKKFAMQSVFKELQDLGVSYQRGLNREGLLTHYILSLEPLRGMILNQSQLVLKAATRLVDDKVIMACNEQHSKLIARNQYLLSYKSEIQDLTSDQMFRIRGFALDLVLGILKQKRSATFIYKHLMDIQAATTRLTEMQKIQNTNDMVIYNFAKVRRVVQQFNELVGRSYLAIAKLEELSKCHVVASDLEEQGEDNVDGPAINSEQIVLKQLFSNFKESNSLMTKIQFDHISSQLLNTRKTISGVSFSLRDMLNCTIRNHMYSNDDRTQLEELYQRFYTALSQLLPEDDDDQINLQRGTILGSLRILLEEAKEKLKPNLESAFMKGDSCDAISVTNHPNLKRLNVRLQKLVRQIKLAVQGICQEESDQCQHAGDHGSLKQSFGGAAKRKLKPFNSIDSETMTSLLRLSQIATHTRNCFITLNREEQSTNIEPLVARLTPILYIYTQDVASYLNIILASLHVKLNLANQVIRFFTDLVVAGFGLPYKVTEESNGTEEAKGKSSDDNVGFGEGQGETDVSNKLEFESQLDDLKQKKDDNEKKDEDESVEAHDNGVEMSEDIDAKAEGPDEKDDKSGDIEEDDQDEADLENLDKELDQVDDDEGNLDKKLWGDDEDQIGDDDEEDLRDAEAEGPQESNKETSMKAKDDGLAKKDDTANKETAEDGRRDDSDDDKMEIVPDDQEAIEETKKDEELDLDEEADQALNRDMEDVQNVDNDSQDDDSLIDLTGADDTLEDMQASDDEDPAERENQQVDNKSEGEISEEDNEPKSATSSQNISINDDEIDQLRDSKLEHILKPDDEELVNPIEETIRNITEKAKELGGQNKSGQEMEGRKVGQHTVYDIMEEQDDDPIDCAEEASQQMHDEEQPDSDGNPRENPVSSGKSKVSGQNDNDCDDAESEEAPDKETSVEEEKVTGEDKNKTRSTKRTLADQSDVEELEAKRQKILDSVENGQEEEEKKVEGDPSVDKSTSEPENNEPKGSQKRKRSTFRHIEKDTKDSVELIDLISSSDEEDRTLPEVGDHLDELKLKPKESEKESKSISDLNNDLSMETAASASLEEISKEEDEGDKENEVSKDSAAPDNPIFRTSSISSIESGELATDSDDATRTVDRNLSTSYNTNFGMLKYISLQAPAKKESDLMERIDNELSKTRQADYDSVDADRLKTLWLECTKNNRHLVSELCQQLQIVLQPTKMTKYKGDYKTGKRLNMRKIISYIASHYRKDKIWLRRTKPSKRTYNICLAVDNSSSMAENNCRQMTYQSLALLANALSLIEAGSLNVVSFGERVNCIHEFGQPYADAQGAQWLRDLRFNESKTYYKLLLEHSCKSFAEQARLNQSGFQQQASISQLLVIISDGRNVTSEEEEVKCYLKQLKSMGVLTLFVIIDDLKRNGGKSIVDVKRCIGIGSNVRMLSYMELFPFPFYVLLRQLETMPSILGDALRQWFELVSNNP